jgi:CheY-like chemotaxis protein
VVHGIVLSHEGTISVESAPGDGTCFTIDLPGLNASPTPVPSVIPADTATASTRPATRARVLYVDDDPALVRLIAKLLERRGFSVAGFTEQGRAIDAVRADPQAFDIVLTDFNMRGLSGVDVARAVRAIRANLPVVLMSGFVDEDTRDRAVAAGVSEVVLKGTSADEISRVVERLLR